MNRRKVVLDAKEMERALSRMAHEIIEHNKGVERLALIGIRTGGVPLAERLRERITAIEQRVVPVGVLDITLYRDDWTRLSHKPMVQKTEIEFPVDDMDIVLVDDVLYTGRTVRAAMDALLDIGRPATIQLAVLVDRGRRQLPIQPDYVGLSMKTSSGEHVNVYLRETDGRDEVVLELKEAAQSEEGGATGQ